MTRKYSDMDLIAASSDEERGRMMAANVAPEAREEHIALLRNLIDEGQTKTGREYPVAEIVLRELESQA